MILKQLPFMINLSVKSSFRLNNYEFNLNAINLKIKKNAKIWNQQKKNEEKLQQIT